MIRRIPIEFEISAPESIPDSAIAEGLVGVFQGNPRLLSQISRDLTLVVIDVAQVRRPLER